MKKTNKNKFPWIFFALAYALSWIFWIPTALSGQDGTATIWAIPFLLGGFGPSLAGIIMVCRKMEKEERRNFWKRTFDFKRISVACYLFMILIFPVLFVLSFLISSFLGNPLPNFETLAQIRSAPFMLVGMLIIGIVGGPLSEELGWRGYALDRLQARWSPLVASLIIAPFWWAWHLPLFFMKGTIQYNWGVGTLPFWIFLIGIVPLSILMTSVYNHNRRSILAPIFLHFTYNFTLNLIYPISNSVFLIEVILLFVTSAIIVLIDESRS
jgi:membrane protease YdiL (CAAX protease family)